MSAIKHLLVAIIICFSLAGVANAQLRTFTWPQGGTNNTGPYASSSIIISDGSKFIGVATSSLGIITPPGGSDTQVQYNDAGAFAGDSDFTFSKLLNKLSVTYASTTAITASGTGFFGNIGSSVDRVGTVYANVLDGLTLNISQGVTGLSLILNENDDACSSANPVYILFKRPTASDGQQAFDCDNGWFTFSHGITVSGTASSTALAVTGTATSTFAGDINLGGGHGSIKLHGLYSDESDGLRLWANNGTPVGIFGTGNTANSLFYGGVNIDGATRLATSINGPLQANAGAVTATTSVGAIYGGTGQTSVTTGDLLYGSATNVWSKLAGVATGNALISGGVGTAPSWGKIGLTTHISGTLPIANGGTNATSQTTNGVNYFDGTSITSGSALTWTGSALRSNGTFLASTTANPFASIQLSNSTFTVSRELTSSSDLMLISSKDNSATRAALHITGNNSAVEAFWVGSNGAVGIGTTTPDARLIVHGAGGTTGAIDTTANLGASLIVSDSSGSVGNGGAIIFGAKQSGTVASGRFAAIKGYIVNGGTNTTGDLLFSTRNAVTDSTLTERMRIMANGWIGIGTQNPLALLSVVGSSNSTNSTTFTGARSMSLINTDTTNNNATMFAMRSVDTAGATSTGASIGGIFTSHAVGALSGDFVINTSNAGTLTEKLRVLANGYVGVGTSSPRDLLTIHEGNLSISKGGADPAAGAETGRLSFRSTDSSVGVYPLETAAISSKIVNNWTATAATWDSLLDFDVTNNGASSTVMRLDNRGYLAVGTTTQSSNRSIIFTDPANGFGDLYLVDPTSANYSDSNKGGTYIRSNEGLLTFQGMRPDTGGGSTVDMTIDQNNHRIGIGDSSPAAMLTVGSGDLFQVDSSGRVFAPVGASGAGNLSYSFVGDTNTGLYRSAADEITFQTGGTSRFTINANGHLVTAGTAPTASSCGTTPSVSGNDISGRITVGSGVVNSCTITFAATHSSSNVDCIVNDMDSELDFTYTTSSSQLVISSATEIGGDKFTYICYRR